MDVDDEANHLAIISESRDSIGKQSERKQKSHGIENFENEVKY